MREKVITPDLGGPGQLIAGGIARAGDQIVLGGSFSGATFHGLSSGALNGYLVRLAQLELVDGRGYLGSSLYLVSSIAAGPDGEVTFTGLFSGVVPLASTTFTSGPVSALMWQSDGGNIDNWAWQGLATITSVGLDVALTKDGHAVIVGDAYSSGDMLGLRSWQGDDVMVGAIDEADGFAVKLARGKSP